MLSDPCPLCDVGVLWPNGWMDTMPLGTEVGSARQHYVRWGPSSSTERATAVPHFSAHVYCGQTAGRIEMPLGTVIGLCPCDIVLDGDTAPSKERGTAAPTFRPTLLWHGRPSQQLLSSCFFSVPSTCRQG